MIPPKIKKLPGLRKNPKGNKPEQAQSAPVGKSPMFGGGQNGMGR